MTMGFIILLAVIALGSAVSAWVTSTHMAPTIRTDYRYMRRGIVLDTPDRLR